MPLDRKPRIAVIGDIMVDVDLHCVCERICQEGPWPVLKVLSQTERPGGAANVAAMCNAIGAETILLGNSDCPSRKTRIVIDNRLIGPRIDNDSTWTMSSTPPLTEISHFDEEIERFDPDAIIVSDHGKGVVTFLLMAHLSCFSIPIFVDPIRSTAFHSKVSAVVGGDHELGSFSGFECIVRKLGPNGLLWTNGTIGGVLQSNCTHCVDPLGAGDQLIATLAIRRVLGDSWKEAIETANVASGLQCERQGCVPVTSKELEAALHRFKYSL